MAEENNKKDGGMLPAGEMERLPGINRPTIPFGADVVTNKTADYPPEHRDLVRWLFAHAKTEGLSLKELGAQTSIHQSTLYKVFLGRYVGADGKPVALHGVCRDIARFKQIYAERTMIHRAGFIETSISRKIWSACQWSLISQTPTFIYGKSQIGKTFALEEYQRRNNHGATIYVRMPATAGAQLFMKELAKACFVSPNSCFEKLRERVLKAVDHTKLVVVDELHECFLACHQSSRLLVLELIREIYDRCKCGMVLCGTNVLKDELWKGRYSEVLEQFRLRGIVEVQLPSKPPRADLDRIAAAWRLEPARGEAEELMKRIVQGHSMGKFVKFLEAASRLAKNRGGRMTWAHFIEAHDVIVKLSVEPKQEAA